MPHSQIISAASTPEDLQHENAVLRQLAHRKKEANIAIIKTFTGSKKFA